MKRWHLLVIGSFLLALWPVWLWYVQRMSDGSDEPFGVLALLVGGWLLFRERETLRIGMRDLVAAMLVLLATGLSSLWLPPLAVAVLAVLSLALVTGVWRTNPSVAAVFALSLPVMASLQFFLGYPLRLVAAWFSSSMLGVLGLGVTRQGTILFWEDVRVGVDPECSGIEMLWLGVLLVCIFCAIRRLPLVSSTVVILVGFVAVVAANCLRVTLLFFKESGMLNLPGWTHEGIGLAIFAGLLWGFNRFFESQKPRSGRKGMGITAVGRRALIPALGTCFLVAVMPFIGGSVSAEPEVADFPGWPETWKGRYLEELPLTDSEKAFARGFPGRIGVFSNGPDKLVFRWVTKPTRKLHSSADCLRAAGYSIQKERDGSFMASRDRQTLFVEERIEAGEGQWQNVSQWYWSAVLGRTKGPWWAITVIRSEW